MKKLIFLVTFIICASCTSSSPAPDSVPAESSTAAKTGPSCQTQQDPWSAAYAWLAAPSWRGGGAEDARALQQGWTKPASIARAWRRDEATWQAVVAPDDATEGRAILLTLSAGDDTWRVTEVSVVEATVLWTEI